MIIGGYYSSKEIDEKISTTKSYFQDDITWCVANAKYKMKFEKLLYVLKPEIWFIHWSLDFLMGAVFFYIFRFDNVFKCYVWNVITFMIIHMGGSVVYQPKNMLARIVYILVAFYGLEWSTLYNSFLISVLTNPLPRWQIATINDAIYYNYELTIPSSYYIQKDLTKSNFMFRKYIISKFIENIIFPFLFFVFCRY